VTIITDPLPILPKIPAYGFATNPRYLVKIIQREGGFELRDRKWAKPLAAYTSVPLETVTYSDTDTTLNFYHAMGGTANSFRFKDWSDYRSCSTDITVTPTALDQPLVLIPGTTTYQLTKQYVKGAMIQYRDIVKPLGSSILIADTTGAVISGASWTLDESSGILTPVGFTPGSWGGEFYVYARFGGDINLHMNSFGVTDFTLTLQELRYGS
jgi:uncharacterized protein (TIGR02217 family)